MSGDRARRGRLRRGAALFLTLAIVAAAGIAAWLLLPWRRVNDLAVEGVAIVAAGRPDGGRKPAGLATPIRIAVTFSTPEDLAAVRARLGVGFIAASLFSCDDPASVTREVVTQRAEYLGDHGRVRRLPARDGRARYIATFDDRLTRLTDHRFRTVAALGGGDLCFALDGGGMWWGKMSSPVVRLPHPS